MRSASGRLRVEGRAVLVPVKAFSRAKERLAPTLGARDRAELARIMAEVVLDAAGDLPVAVVCDDAEVEKWAARRGAAVILAPGRGLDGAVGHGVDRLREAGATRVMVVHGDLPLARELGSLEESEGGVTIVPDRRDDGSNVVSVPASAGFRFSYGPGSFERHCAEARRIGLALRVVREPALTLDVDEPGDIPAALLARLHE